MQFEYFLTHTANDVLEIEDIGNCAIDIFNDRGEEALLIIDTYLGRTRIFKFGPFNPDFDVLPDNVDCILKQFNYSQIKINSLISQFLNSNFCATQAFLISKEEALGKCRNLIDYMKSDIY